jgi:hypothetical protein
LKFPLRSASINFEWWLERPNTGADMNILRARAGNDAPGE